MEEAFVCDNCGGDKFFIGTSMMFLTCCSCSKMHPTPNTCIGNEWRLAALREVREMVKRLPVHLEPVEVAERIDALIAKEERK